MPGLFVGAEYDPKEDDERLTGQILRVWDAMKDSEWRTLSEIEAITGDPPASISAQLRHLRKEKFGSYVVERRARGLRSDGLYEYRVLPPDPAAPVVTTPVKKYNGYQSGLMVAAKILMEAEDFVSAKKQVRGELMKAFKRA